MSATVEGGESCEVTRRTPAKRSTLFFAVGAAVAVGGGLTLLLSPTSDAPSADAGVSLSPAIGPGASGVVASGRF